ncbi:hypothetical protein C8Q73DRAFT_710106 [Cubamyces lactineus]|nr:hypothetical protein C8Q73DRAFT_710106 [Cubamyces lactineus]
MRLPVVLSTHLLKAPFLHGAQPAPTCVSRPAPSLFDGTRCRQSERIRSKNGGEKRHRAEGTLSGELAFECVAR